MNNARIKPAFHRCGLLFPLLLVFSSTLLSTAWSSKAGNLSPPSTVEKIIRNLNLFPELDVGAVEDDGPKLVEKKIRFPYDSGSIVQELGHHAGYFKLPHSRNASMFYFFFESRSIRRTDPVVVWLSGGPGCSSSIALFHENGPFQFANSSSSLVWNDYGWDKVSNLIYLDQPIGTGFSYPSYQGDIHHGTEAASVDFYDFLQAFFEKHSQYVKNDFYITGESYAGHYIPAFAARIHKANKNRNSTVSTYINLKGLAIGNGLTNPEIQYGAYADYALGMKLINRTHHKYLSKLFIPCRKLIRSCGTMEYVCTQAFQNCRIIFGSILQSVGYKINYYDIRKTCIGPLCYDFSNMENLLNEKSVKRTLDVGDREFVPCNMNVYRAMTGDFMKNFGAAIPALLHDGIKLLVYAGEYDLICNWLGNWRWVKAMEWSGQKKFRWAPLTVFMVDGKEAGKKTSYGPLTFVKVYRAGHMVPMDQPKPALAMLSRWMHGKPM